MAWLEHRAKAAAAIRRREKSEWDVAQGVISSIVHQQFFAAALPDMMLVSN
jgi:hypothetical protein